MRAWLRKWLERELRWPMGQQEVALIAIPIVALLLPVAARDTLFANQGSIWFYAGFAGVVSIVWLTACVAAVIRNREAFYRRHVWPLLDKEYRNG